LIPLLRSDTTTSAFSIDENYDRRRRADSSLMRRTVVAKGPTGKILKREIHVEAEDAS